MNSSVRFLLVSYICSNQKWRLGHCYQSIAVCCPFLHCLIYGRSNRPGRRLASVCCSGWTTYLWVERLRLHCLCYFLACELGDCCLGLCKEEFRPMRSFAAPGVQVSRNARHGHGHARRGPGHCVIWNVQKCQPSPFVNCWLHGVGHHLRHA